MFTRVDILPPTAEMVIDSRLLHPIFAPAARAQYLKLGRRVNLSSCGYTKLALRTWWDQKTIEYWAIAPTDLLTKWLAQTPGYETCHFQILLERHLYPDRVENFIIGPAVDTVMFDLVDSDPPGQTPTQVYLFDTAGFERYFDAGRTDRLRAAAGIAPTSFDFAQSVFALRDLAVDMGTPIIDLIRHPTNGWVWVIDEDDSDVAAPACIDPSDLTPMALSASMIGADPWLAPFRERLSWNTVTSRSLSDEAMLGLMSHATVHPSIIGAETPISVATPDLVYLRQIVYEHVMQLPYYDGNFTFVDGQPGAIIHQGTGFGPMPTGYTPLTVAPPAFGRIGVHRVDVTLYASREVIVTVYSARGAPFQFYIDLVWYTLCSHSLINEDYLQ